MIHVIVLKSKHVFAQVLLFNSILIEMNNLNVFNKSYLKIKSFKTIIYANV